MNYIDYLKRGSKIHIKKSNKGKFSEYCGGKVTEECIEKGKRSSSAVIRKRATFADNARHWVRKGQSGFSTSFDEDFRNMILRRIWSGESLDDIAMQYNIPLSTLTRLNYKAPSDTLTSRGIDLSGVVVNPNYMAYSDTPSQQPEDDWPEVVVIPRQSAYSDTPSQQPEDDWPEVVVIPRQYDDGEIEERTQKATDTPTNLNDRMKFAMNYLMTRGFTKAAAAGIVGVFAAESQLKPGLLNKAEAKKYGRSAGRGIGQWSNERR